MLVTSFSLSLWLMSWFCLSPLSTPLVASPNPKQELMDEPSAYQAGKKQGKIDPIPAAFEKKVVAIVKDLNKKSKKNQKTLKERAIELLKERERKRERLGWQLYFINLFYSYFFLVLFFYLLELLFMLLSQADFPINMENKTLFVLYTLKSSNYPVWQYVFPIWLTYWIWDLIKKAYILPGLLWCWLRRGRHRQ